ncbi:MAG TPA: thermonuclease family protein [Planctomycetota bacterium]|jgi:micrococcal nuclease|nr:thermonuclease family protein [Planctomycetota bacterium]
MLQTFTSWIATATLLLAPQIPAARKPAAEWVELERVVDADTIHVRRGGAIEKLRLLCVDAEERLGKGHSSTPTKPQTVFGEECALWAEKLFAGLQKDGAPVKVGLVFPGGVEKRDVYGRLLCHVLLPDGTNYELLLVQVGRSPYFNKYGNDLLDHEAFQAAQRSARAAKLGIWNPATNQPTTPGAPAAKRPYAELLAWWNARATAVDDWRRRSAAEPDKVADAEDKTSLERATRSGTEVDVFGEVDRVFEEKSGDQTVLFRTSDKDAALRVDVPADAREAHAVLHIEAMTREFKQNYAWVHGKVLQGTRGFEMRSDSPDRWRRAGPECALPPPKRSQELSR